MEVSTKRLVMGFILIFLLGVFFAIVNGYYVSTEDDPLPIIVYAVSFISIILGAFIVILFQWKINKMQINRVMKILPREERKVIQILLDNNNKIEQNYLVVLSGYNKVKISRIVKKLELREIIDKRNLGNTNLIILKI
jgi:uncharacterized membrane protein